MRLASLLAVVLFLASCGGSVGSSDSGIRGRALVGICAVEQQGMDCTAPIEATFEVRREGRLVETVQTDKDGRFTVRLEPDTYVLEQQGDPFPILKPVQVTVPDHGFATVTLAFDSGIR